VLSVSARLDEQIREEISKGVTGAEHGCPCSCN